MLKRSGYSANVAGGLLSAAGIGALLSPPTLGAAAFIIAEYLQVTYLDVLVMAAIPTLLYYLSCWLMVEADARRLGIVPVEPGAAWVLGLVAWSRSASDEARAVLEDVGARFLEVGHLRSAVLARSALTGLAVEEGRVSDAIRLAALATDLTSGLPGLRVQARIGELWAMLAGGSSADLEGEAAALVGRKPLDGTRFLADRLLRAVRSS